MKSVLVVSYFPPFQETTGVIRISNFLKHLPGAGWQPVVLTMRRSGETHSDTASQTYRADDVIHAAFGLITPRSTANRAASPQAAVPLIPNESWLGRLRDRIMVPDTKLGWVPAARRLGLALVRQHQPQLIFSSSPPETNHLVAHFLHRQCGVPWVADLRDGWMYEPPNQALRRLPIRRGIEAWLERQTLAQADRVVTATEPIADDLRQRYPWLSHKATAISNGYADEEFAGLTRQRQPDGTFRLVYTGALSLSGTGRSAEALWKGLETLAVDPDTPLRVHFIGRLGPQEQAAVQARGLSHLVTFSPPVSRREAHQIQLDADMLLLITVPGHRSEATLKLFDYIGAGVPIFALARDNAAAQIVQEHKLGITVAPDDPAAITEALRAVLERQTSPRNVEDWRSQRWRFEWRHLTEQLSRVFDSVAS